MLDLSPYFYLHNKRFPIWTRTHSLTLRNINNTCGNSNKMSPSHFCRPLLFQLIRRRTTNCITKQRYILALDNSVSKIIFLIYCELHFRINMLHSTSLKTSHKTQYCALHLRKSKLAGKSQLNVTFGSVSGPQN